MQAQATLGPGALPRLLAAVYEGAPRVAEAMSAPDADIASFASSQALAAYIAAEGAAGRSWVDLVLHYPDTQGSVICKRSDLDAAESDGAACQHTLEGWGLIQLEIEGAGTSALSCRVAVNTQKRAIEWAPTLPELGGPLQWDWKAVERHARRLIRVLRQGASS
jgi:hypothetical protein